MVTRHFGKPLFDAKSLASNLHDVAAVFDLVTPKAAWGGLSAALPEGAAMTRTQFDSMQELVEFITDDTAISTSPPPTRCSSTSPSCRARRGIFARA